MFISSFIIIFFSNSILSVKSIDLFEDLDEEEELLLFFDKRCIFISGVLLLFSGSSSVF